MNLHNWLEVVRNAYTADGEELELSFERFLLSEIDPTTWEEKRVQPIKVCQIMTRYFWKKAVQGDPFGDVSRVSERFGKTVEEHYGLNSGPFINLARTYWTYSNRLVSI